MNTEMQKIIADFYRDYVYSSVMRDADWPDDHPCAQANRANYKMDEKLEKMLTVSQYSCFDRFILDMNTMYFPKFKQLFWEFGVIYATRVPYAGQTIRDVPAALQTMPEYQALMKSSFYSTARTHANERFQTLLTAIGTCQKQLEKYYITFLKRLEIWNHGYFFHGAVLAWHFHHINTDQYFAEIFS